MSQKIEESIRAAAPLHAGAIADVASLEPSAAPSSGAGAPTSRLSVARLATQEFLSMELGARDVRITKIILALLGAAALAIVAWGPSAAFADPPNAATPKAEPPRQQGSEAAATPLTYAVVGFLKRREGCDVFDRDLRFNPLAISD